MCLCTESKAFCTNLCFIQAIPADQSVHNPCVLISGVCVTYTAIIKAPFGHLGIVVDEGLLVKLAFLDNRTELLAPMAGTLAARVADELDAYFANATFPFSIPFQLHGTPFQRRVWSAIETIPSGDTLTYQQVANRLGTAPRPVGNACGRNPIPLIVPCHRVIARNGLGGFNQSTGRLTVGIKQWLLAHEQRC